MIYEINKYKKLIEEEIYNNNQNNQNKLEKKVETLQNTVNNLLNIIGNNNRQ